MMCVARKKERKKYCINQNCQTVPVPIESLGVSCCKERTMHERKWRPVGNLEGTTTRRRRRRSWVTDMAWPFCYLEATVLAVENWWYAVAQSKPVCGPNSGFCRLKPSWHGRRRSRRCPAQRWARSIWRVHPLPSTVPPLPPWSAAAEHLSFPPTFLRLHICVSHLYKRKEAFAQPEKLQNCDHHVTYAYNVGFQHTNETNRVIGFGTPSFIILFKKPRF